MKKENRRLFTAEALRAQSKAFLINKHSDLCELGVSVVIPFHPALVLGSHGFRDRSESIPFHESNQTLVNPFDHRRPLLNKPCVDLYSAGTGFNFFIGIGGRKDATDADDR